MNFLAHLFIAERTPEAMIGCILPDLVRGRPSSDHSPAILAAAAQHRRVDAFTDTHPVVARSKSRIRERHGRYAGILMDVFYDHLLAAEFTRYSPDSLNDFARGVYETFATHAALLPPPMSGAVEAMIEHDWLNCYATVDGIALTLRRMSARLTQRFERPVALEHAAEDLLHHHAELRKDFDEFFPQLLTSEPPRTSQQPRRPSHAFTITTP